MTAAAIWIVTACSLWGTHCERWKSWTEATILMAAVTHLIVFSCCFGLCSSWMFRSFRDEYCLYLHGEWMWFRCMLIYLGRNNVSFMLNADVNFGKSELQETECSLYRANLCCKFQWRPFFGKNGGRHEGGQTVVLNLVMCSWYQSEALLCPWGRRPPETLQLRQRRPTPVKTPHKSVLDTREHLFPTPRSRNRYFPLSWYKTQHSHPSTGTTPLAIKRAVLGAFNCHLLRNLSSPFCDSDVPKFGPSSPCTVNRNIP